jgi:hypothetical protein
MSNLKQLILGSVKKTPVPTDATFAEVVALIHGNGTSGSSNNTFTGTNGTTNYTLTAGGTPTPGSFSPYGSAWSTNQQTTTASYQTYGASASASPGSQSFTVEAFVFFNSLPTTTGTTGQYTVWQKGVSASSNFEMSFGVLATAASTYALSFQVSASGTSASIVSSTSSTIAIATGQWYHMAVTGSAGSVNFFFNGLSAGSAAPGVSTIYSSTGAVGIGNTSTGSNTIWQGYISNVRVVYGSQVYSGSSYTVPTSPLTVITGTNFLGCATHGLIDQSSNVWTIAPSGTVSVSKLNPFGANGTPYTATTYGGSVFTQTGSSAGTTSLLAPTSVSSLAFGTSDFTVEMWVRLNSVQTSGVQYFLDSRTSSVTTGWNCGFTSTTTGHFLFNSGTTAVYTDTATTDCPPLAWNHVVYARQSGTGRFFINGVQIGTVTDSTNYTGTQLTIGNSYAGSQGLCGYISDVRIVNGTAEYTAAFTPPTAPLSAVTNTVFLYHGTDAAIYDNAMQQNLTTAGSVAISTTQQKFGTGSMYFQGSSVSASGITLPLASTPVWGSASWTIEGWVYPTTQVNAIYMWQQRNNTSAYAPMIIFINGTTIYCYLSTTGSSWTTTLGSNAGGAPSLNVWSHVAVVRNGTSLVIYVNGTNVASTTASGSLYNTTTPFNLGSANNVSYNFTGYMQDFRITYGVAVYTANFTPPTSAFPNQ